MMLDSLATRYAMGMGFSRPLHGYSLILVMCLFCKPVLFGFRLTRWMGMQLTLQSRPSKAGQLISSKAVTGNRSVSVSFDGFTVYNPDAILLTVTKWSTVPATSGS